jgi:hypothetical protein
LDRFSNATTTLRLLRGSRFVCSRGAPDSLRVGSGFEIESLRELGRVKKILRIALIQHLVGLADIRVEQANDPDERASENSILRLDSKFLLGVSRAPATDQTPRNRTLLLSERPLLQTVGITVHHGR